VFPRDIVCLRNMSINTLHKGDDDDDNNNNNNNQSNKTSDTTREGTQYIKVKTGESLK